MSLVCKLKEKMTTAVGSICNIFLHAVFFFNDMPPTDLTSDWRKVDTIFCLLKHFFFLNADRE